MLLVWTDWSTMVELASLLEQLKINSSGLESQWSDNMPRTMK